MGRFEKGNTIGQRFPKGDAQRETARKGAIASNEKKRQIKSLKEALEILLEMEHTNRQGEKKKGYEVIAIGLYNKAMKGDTKAIKLLAELVEQYKQKVSLGGDGTPFELKVVQTTPDLKDKVSGYLDGSGLDGEGV